jgi:N-acetylglucosaminyl-diphospho-decaprenol L-rhamnosyltransferase
VSADLDSTPLVAVVVVSWNTRELLDRCLASLEPDVDSGLADVWVVDNASSDGSAELVRERHPRVHLIASEENLGFGRAINLAAARTATPWLAVSNADVSLRPGALAQLVASGTADPGAGVIAPQLVHPDGLTQHSVWAFPTIVAALAQNAGPRLTPRSLADRLAIPGAWNSERARRVPWAVGAFLLVRREAWDEVGGFDPTLWMSAEDLDLGWQMREAGWATRYEPRAVIDHAESSAAGQVWGEGLRVHWQRCAYGWMLRRRGRLRTATMGLLNFVGSGLRLAVALAGPHADGELRARGRWTLVHLYAFAPRRVLDKYR